jgi:DNA mismatch repair protein MutL
MSIRTAEQRIRILPENVINQIAAGEVILRPASVLKELLENSIDAEARHISVWTEEGGKTRIQVTDDGVGMSPIDAELCFERHATSKIVSVRDLYQIQTKGFRGEALASIAAVAHVELFTRRPTDEIGTHIVMAFGERRLKEPARCNPGTTLIVTQLFRQLPVRRKSLRSTPTEHRHNLQEFLRVAYPHPDIAYQYYHNGERLYHLPAQTLQERILALHPTLNPNDLIPISEETPLFSIYGYLLSPEKTPPDNRENYLFINQRFIRHLALQQALWQICKPLLRGEARPLYWLFLRIPPHEIDINVIPSKTEARLIYEVEIRQMLMSIVQKAIAQSYMPLPAGGIVLSEVPLVQRTGSDSAPSMRVDSHKAKPMLFSGLRGGPSESPALLIAGRYLITSAHENGAWVIDVWRAYQRLSYEVFLRKGPLPAQGLLFPVHLPAGPDVLATFATWQDALAHYGLQIELREGRELVLHTLPAELPPALAQPLLEELFRLAQETPDITEAMAWDETLPKLLYTILEKQQPRSFSLQEAQHLVERLDQAQDPHHTPTGQPIRLFLSREMLESLFR